MGNCRATIITETEFARTGYVEHFYLGNLCSDGLQSESLQLSLFLLGGPESSRDLCSVERGGIFILGNPSLLDYRSLLDKKQFILVEIVSADIFVNAVRITRLNWYSGTSCHGYLVLVSIC